MHQKRQTDPSSSGDPLNAATGGDTADVVSAVDLAGADIVLTTYDVLRKDAWRVGEPDRRLRHAKKYEVGACMRGAQVPGRSAAGGEGVARAAVADEALEDCPSPCAGSQDPAQPSSLVEGGAGRGAGTSARDACGVWERG